MSDILYWNSSVVITPLGGGLFRLFQPSYRRNLVVGMAMLPLIDKLADGLSRDDFRAAFDTGGKSMTWMDATEFTLWDHVFRNPALFNETFDEAGLVAGDCDGFLALAVDAGFLADTKAPTLDYNKRTFADRFRGTYHEQIGTECLFNRTEPEAWWKGQKFEPDMVSVRPTPYRYIEETFLEAYFAEHLPGLNVLEIGCGTGHFTAMMSRYAENTIGLDYNADYIDIAKKIPVKKDNGKLDFIVGDIIDLSGTAGTISGAPFDRVVLIDTFLFLFDTTFQNALVTHRKEIMQNIRGLLKPGGQLLIMDPHPFWLTPWIGPESQPVGLIAEYRKRWFKVTPTLEEVSTLLHETGFSIRRILEPSIDDAYKAIDPTAYAFMSQFPQWWFFEVNKD